MALLKARETLYRVRASASISQKSTGLLSLMIFFRVVTFFIYVWNFDRKDMIEVLAKHPAVKGQLDSDNGVS